MQANFALTMILLWSPTLWFPLTCVLGELFEQLVPIPVLWNVAHKEPVVIERYGNANFLSLPRFKVIQLDDKRDRIR